MKNLGQLKYFLRIEIARSGRGIFFHNKSICWIFWLELECFLATRSNVHRSESQTWNFFKSSSNRHELLPVVGWKINLFIICKARYSLCCERYKAVYACAKWRTYGGSITNPKILERCFGKRFNVLKKWSLTLRHTRMPIGQAIKQLETLLLVTLLSWKVISLLGRARSRRLLHVKCKSWIPRYDPRCMWIIMD